MSFEPLPVPTISANESQKDIKLSDNQEAMRLDVLSHFDKPDYRLPDLEEDGQLTDDEKMWLSNECILRYLRACKWHASDAKARLEGTLLWRREYGFYGEAMSSKAVESEAVTGKEVIFGYDLKGRPATYMFPSRQNTNDPGPQLKFAVFMLERAVDLMGPGVETLDLLINFADKAKHPSFSTARQMLHIIQTHYPERLGLALIINVPFLVRTFFNLILPFVDPITAQKIKFNPSLFDKEKGFFERDQVMNAKSGWGGDRDFEYAHEKYWNAFVGMCEERRGHMKRRWEEMGKKIGTSEWEMKTGWSKEEANGIANGGSTKEP